MQDHKEVNKKFGDKVKAKRLEFGLTQKELSKRTYIPLAMIAATERGMCILTIREVCALANILDIDPMVLLGY